jgi:hypothetical protein
MHPLPLVADERKRHYVGRKQKDCQYLVLTDSDRLDSHASRITVQFKTEISIQRSFCRCISSRSKRINFPKVTTESRMKANTSATITSFDTIDSSIVVRSCVSMSMDHSVWCADAACCKSSNDMVICGWMLLYGYK